MKQKVLVIFGGQSTEHEVSRISAATVIKNLEKDKYDVFPLGITKDGRWLLYNGSFEHIPGGQWEKRPECRPAFISPDREIGGLLVKNAEGRYDRIAVDIVFPVLHGKMGEDGTIQGLLELAGLPYIGCGTTSSALCMDKAFAKFIAQSGGIPQAKWVFVSGYEIKNDLGGAVVKLQNALCYPMFVKPANYGSSIGINKASDTDSLKKALAEAARYDNRIVVEEGVDAQEIEVAVLGNDSPIASGCGEIVPSRDFYDYNAKYVDNKSELYIPARLPEEIAERVRNLAISAYTLLGCEGMARVDFFVLRKTGDVLFNEINTIPGFTGISMYPMLFEAAGIPIPKLVDRLIKLGLERHKEAYLRG